MNKPNFKAFTIKANGKLRELISDIGVSIPIIGEQININDQRVLKTKALWDTGATNSVVTKKTASSLGLKPISIAKVGYGSGFEDANVYLVNIYLPNQIVIPGVRVTECADTTGNFGLLIGMDIITLGDFSITNKNKCTTFSFRLPSIDEIDYVKDHNIIINKPKFPYSLCPCGSGRQYKNCHGALKIHK